jgi:hypothetical protein
MDKKNQITEGVIWKQLLIFFFPIMVGTLFQQLYNTVDAIIVGRFVGKQALASVGGSAAVLTNFVIGFFTGLSGSHCHHFPILRGEKLETIEQRTSHCICLFYHSKYFNLRHWLVFYSCSSAPFEDTCGCHTGFYSVS